MSVVVCRNINFSQSGCSVLRDVNITVAQGQIYGLLGPSGCGKTSLLKCLLGDLVADSGTLSVMGLEPGRTANRKLGYMPQEDAVCDLFSVRETFIYFGNIYGMTDVETHSRMRFLCELLGLETHARVRHMSGGQKRRLSLAVCVLHAPPILILDEPTVGVDPLLSHDIWKHLRSLTDEFGTTIIITTHYIEEASSADMVALMHDGRILVQSNPKQLIASYGVKTLEDVLLEVCRRPADVKDHHTQQQQQQQQTLTTGRSTEISHEFIENTCCLFASLRRIKTLLFKERCSIARHPGTILYKCIFPLITLGFFFYTMECNLPDLPVAIVDREQSSLSSLVGELFGSQKHIEVIRLNHSKAQETLKQRSIHAVLTLYDNFSISWKSSLEIDPINPYFRTTIEKAVRDTFINPLISTVNVASLLRAKYLYGDVGDQVYKSVYHRVVAQLSFGPSILASVTHVFVSSHDSFIRRSKVAGCHTFEVAVAFFISQGILVLVQALLLVIYLFFKVSACVNFVSWLLIYVLLAGVGFSGISLSLLLCSECSTFTSALYSALLLNTVTFVMCGEIWPREGMPVFLRTYIAPLWPVSYPADAVGVILYKNRLIEHNCVQLGIGAITAWTVIPIAILILINSCRNKSVF